MASAVESWRKHLVDLGGRNSLLWYRDLPDGSLDVTSAHPAGVAKLLSGHPVRLSELLRQPGAYAEACRRARAIRSKTEELAEERGVSAGFLAMGMASWDVPPSYPRAPKAPVLLRQATLRPVPRSRDDFVIELGEDIELNAVLAQYLDSERGVHVDADELVEMSHTNYGIDPEPAFDELNALCAGVPGFRISPSLILGTFSYAKLPMVLDLTTQGDRLGSHDVIAALAGDPEALATVQAQAPPSPTEMDPVDEWLVLDADASQQAAIAAVCAGSHLVLKGPPGTGKSQTIANLITTLAAQGRRVLFVAEKRAAIDAVVGRLERRGLGELVLDAYDGRPQRRALAESLTATLDRVAAEADSHAPPVSEPLRDRRQRLLDHRRAMHEVRHPWGVTVDEAQTTICNLGALDPAPRSHVRLQGDELRAIPLARRDELAEALEVAASLEAWTSGDEVDPWYGARIIGSDHTQRTHDLVNHLANSRLNQHRAMLDDLADKVGLNPPHTVLEAQDQLELMSRVHGTLETFRPELFEAPIDDLVAATGSRAYRLEHGIQLGSFERQRLRRQARTLLRPGQPPADLHGVLVRAATQRRQWRELGGPGSRPSAPVEVPQVQRAHEELRDDLDWLALRLEGTAEGTDLIHTELTDVHARLRRLAAASDRLAVVPRVVSVLDGLRAHGLGEVIDDFAERRVPADRVRAEFEFIWWSSVLDHVSAADETYGEHKGDYLRRVAREYAYSDTEHIDSTVARVREAVDNQIRTVAHDFPEQATMVRTEAAKARRHRPLKELLSTSPELMTSVRPCWAMSPLVVASVVPPGMWFDVVVFDEASQVPPAQAISAISRGAQVVVAGDPKQLPPTSFFTSDVDDDTAPEDLRNETGVRSVLDVLSTMLPLQELSWHYRSQDERLIAFSNAQIYRGGLVTFPGTTSGEGVIRLDVVSARSPDGESAQGEVERVVQVVLDHARQRPQESLGVITLGLRHAQRVSDAVRRALEDEPELAEFFSHSTDEPFFVKNLERVQGDERDAVVLSVGFGRQSDGKVLHKFGPLNLEGGERRLNVAITRARKRMTVISSFSGDELEPSRLRARGALMLRDFLLYAASGGSARRVGSSMNDSEDDMALADSLGVEDHSAKSGRAARPKPAVVGGRRRLAASTGSIVDRPRAEMPAQRPLPPLVAFLAERLRSKGLIVHTTHGISAHPLDLAVEDPMEPGRLLLAIETDGPVYAGMTSVRDRDRLRVEQLRRLGWEHERVWTVDVFRDPARDIARIVNTVTRASQERAASRRRVQPPMEAVEVDSREPEEPETEPAEVATDAEEATG